MACSRTNCDFGLGPNVFKTSDHLIPFPSTIATRPGIPLNLLVDVFLVESMESNSKDINVNFKGNERERAKNVRLENSGVI